MCLYLCTCALLHYFQALRAENLAVSNLWLYLNEIDLLLITLLEIVSMHDSVAPSICSNKQWDDGITPNPNAECQNECTLNTTHIHIHQENIQGWRYMEEDQLLYPWKLNNTHTHTSNMGSLDSLQRKEEREYLIALGLRTHTLRCWQYESFIADICVFPFTSFLKTGQSCPMTGKLNHQISDSLRLIRLNQSSPYCNII